MATDKFENLTTADVTLYHRPACGFCSRVMYALKDMNLDIPKEDIWQNSQARTDLYKGGGKNQVPALRIRQPNGDYVWMYESLDIIDFLQQHFSE
ncbi:putative glutaredoxin [Teredinibacter turnerae T7901]|uniref:Glutaredoxin n=1 Tax=Teredinibacter turnerae (strain ATCC 39867 / T7901) TaxID=377629 RepID=C5BPV3_TERTT|nr:glutathione S-transferase N-terminal domain-containing protein [Teredinibacter turnerae]ACR10907.1 putative glutaredoxin [Teredinibacter turnerae T7901]